MIQFLSILFTMTLLFSQSFFDVYKSDLPKSVLEGKHKIGNIEDLVNEYAEISPILIYSFIENLDRQSKNQKAEINLSLLRDQLLTERKLWVENLQIDTLLSSSLRSSLQGLILNYTFVESDSIQIDYDIYKINEKFNYILAKHMSKESFGSFKNSVNYEHLVSVESYKRVSYLNALYEKSDFVDPTESGSIASYLYLVKATPYEFTKAKTNFTILEYLKGTQDLKQEIESKTFENYKKNFNLSFNISVLFGSVIEIYSPITMSENADLHKLEASSFKLQIERNWQLKNSFKAFSYISTFFSYDIISDDLHKFDIPKFIVVSTAPKNKIFDAGNYILYKTTQQVAVKLYGEIDNVTQFEYGISTPIYIGALWSKTRSDYFTLEFGLGLRHRAFRYTLNIETKSRSLTIIEYSDGSVERTYGSIGGTPIVENKTEEISEIDFLYDLSILIKPIKYVRIDLRFRNERLLFGLAYSF